jgi:microsomal dipeptidase-like Zn-dependent dipeptidase
LIHLSDKEFHDRLLVEARPAATSHTSRFSLFWHTKRAQDTMKIASEKAQAAE